MASGRVTHPRIRLRNRACVGIVLIAGAAIALITLHAAPKDFLNHCRESGEPTRACAQKLAWIKSLHLHEDTVQATELAYTRNAFLFTTKTTDSQKTDAFGSFMVCYDQCHNRLATPYTNVPLSECESTCLCAANSYLTSLALEIDETLPKSREVLKHNLKVCIKLHTPTS